MEYSGMISVAEPEKDTEIVITTKKKQKEPYPGYTIFGNGKETRNGGQSMDILDVCKQLNKPEMALMEFFRDMLARNNANNEDNINLVIPTKEEEWTPYLATALKKNFSHMECVGIIRRMKRGTYMVNPWLFIPPERMDYHKHEWSKLNGCKDDK